MIKHVVCALSGGVDSAVTALLLKRKNFNVTGVFMRNWDFNDERGQCSANQDSEDAQFVCRHIGIPYHEVTFMREYWNEVFTELIEGYQHGISPNPDVLCNRHIKFGHLFRYATDRLNADALATGHYARSTAGPYLEHLSNCTQGVHLLQSGDQSKDQTLFLSQINQNALQKTMFPVGEMKKSMVKRIAAEAGLDQIVKKRESAGICFIGSRHFQEFIEQYVEPKPGNFVDVETGAIVGKHREVARWPTHYVFVGKNGRQAKRLTGVQYWTIGQRSHIGGLSKAYFVVSRHPPSRTIFVASGTDHPALFSKYLSTVRPHWINSPPQPLQSGNVGVSFPCQFRFQHTHPLLDCRVSVHSNGGLDIELERPLRSLSPGQYAVLYDGEVCLGSAPIQSVGPTLFEMFRDSISRRVRSNSTRTVLEPT